MKQTRSLALRRESLTELTPAEMAIAGGAADRPPSVDTACNTQEINWWLRDVTVGLSVHWHCSWSCI